MISCPWFSWRGWHSRGLGALLSGEEPSRPGSSCLALVGTLVVILPTFVFSATGDYFCFPRG